MRSTIAFVILAALAILGALAAPAAATTLTFDQLAHDTSERIYGPSTGDISTSFSFVDEGFIVRVQPSPAIVWGRTDPRNAGQGGATLTNLDGRARFSFEPAAGGLFTLNSFQVASFYNGALDETGFGNNFTLRVNGDITTDQVFGFDSKPGFQTFTINRSNVASFQILNTYLQLDNVVVNETTSVGAVPEPASWAMLITGFGLAGAQLRRQRAISTQ
jgi:hypothetical protein